ncbi:hypothetical protein [Cetobacterium sp.]|uniref:hypothetical protein n=1 Tax=Cetobacterium sp. TaxID=2071632 RepID=UPI002FC89DDB
MDNAEIIAMNIAYNFKLNPLEVIMMPYTWQMKMHSYIKEINKPQKGGEQC